MRAVTFVAFECLYYTYFYPSKNVSTFQRPFVSSWLSAQKWLKDLIFKPFSTVQPSAMPKCSLSPFCRPFVTILFALRQCRQTACPPFCRPLGPRCPLSTPPFVLPTPPTKKSVPGFRFPVRGLVLACPRLNSAEGFDFLNPSATFTLIFKYIINQAEGLKHFSRGTNYV